MPGGQAVPPAKIERFTDNLYEKIDGKEGMFRAFYFRRACVSGSTRDSQTQDAFDVYIYDMGEPVNAFGIYMGERSPTAEAWTLGRDAYVSGTSAYFCKDKYYVNVLGPPEGAADKLEVSKAIATAIAETIPSNDKPFWAEQYLPAEGRVPNSAEVRGHQRSGVRLCRSGCSGRRTRLASKTYQKFLVQADDAAAARGLFDKFAEATAKYDKVMSKEAPTPRAEIMVGESLGVFSVAFTRGLFFGGVAECEDQALAIKQAEALRAGFAGVMSAGAAVASTNETGQLAGRQRGAGLRNRDGRRQPDRRQSDEPRSSHVDGRGGI